MDEDIIPKTVIIDFSLLPESMQKYHINTAQNEEITLEEQLISFIERYTEQVQEEIKKGVREGAERVTTAWRELGITTDHVIGAFDLEEDEESGLKK